MAEKIKTDVDRLLLVLAMKKICWYILWNLPLFLFLKPKSIKFANLLSITCH